MLEFLDDRSVAVDHCPRVFLSPLLELVSLVVAVGAVEGAVSDSCVDSQACRPLGVCAHDFFPVVLQLGCGGSRVNASGPVGCGYLCSAAGHAAQVSVVSVVSHTVHVVFLSAFPVHSRYKYGVPRGVCTSFGIIRIQLG